jgi:hypothetical protein
VDRQFENIMDMYFTGASLCIRRKLQSRHFDWLRAPQALVRCSITLTTMHWYYGMAACMTASRNC